ncbi:MAG TPA: ArsA-related P-loop ATPase [Actinomycetota bacterium]|nr:ArsA-related P-loop ATPase [Actinomycetota bacterium]
MTAQAAKLATASLTESRLIVVSGKGGVGKTTVAAAIATAAAAAGKKVLLAEVEQRDGLAPLFGRPSMSYAEVSLAQNITGIAVVPDEALTEYLQLFYGIGRIARPLLTGKAVEFATSTAPGLRDILLIGKIKEAENRRTGGMYTFDLIVLDAPPTGRLPRFLDAPRAVVELVQSGAIRQQAQGVLDMLTDPRRTRVVLVTLPEEMPVRETIEGAGTMREMGIALGPVIVNGLSPQPFKTGQQRALAKDGAAALLAEAGAAGVDLSEEAALGVASVANAHARRAANQRRALKELTDELDLSQIRLPALFTPQIGPAERRRLADELVAQGAIA